jgi:hypothetical protein
MTMASTVILPPEIRSRAQIMTHGHTAQVTWSKEHSGERHTVEEHNVVIQVEEDRSQGTRGSGVFIPLHGGYATREQLEEKIETEVQRDPNEQIESRRESRQRHLLFIEGVREKLDNIEQQLLDPTLTVKKRTGLAQMRENAIGVLNEHAKREAESQHEIQEWFGNDPVLAQRPQGRGKSKEGKGAELQYLSESTAKMHLG